MMTVSQAKQSGSIPSTKKKGGRPSLSIQVAEAIRGQIEAGYYAPGDKLPTEPALIDKPGFSRTVVREAIAALRADGLVESRHGSGVFVIGPRQTDPGLRLFTSETNKISDIIEELELRIGVEVEAAALVAVRSSPAQEVEIQSQVDLFQRPSLKGSQRTKLTSSSIWRSLRRRTMDVSAHFLSI